MCCFRFLLVLLSRRLRRFGPFGVNIQSMIIPCDSHRNHSTIFDTFEMPKTSFRVKRTKHTDVEHMEYLILLTFPLTSPWNVTDSYFL